MNIKNLYIKIPLLIIILFVLNILGSSFHKRLDLTKDKRYTLSNQTIDIVNNIDNPIIIKVYLQGDFPAEFKRIQLETNQFLEELSALNSNIKFRFIDPTNNTQELIKKGLQPSRLSVQENGKTSEAIIFPWARINYKGKSKNVSLLNSSFAPTQEIQLQNSVESLEYEFANALLQLTSEKSKKIAILKGNGELNDIHLFSFLKKLGEHYKLAEFTLDSVDSNPQKTLNDLSQYDLSIIAKPTSRFSEKEKFTLDQYIINGGKTLWLIDNVYAELDSLMKNGKSMTFNRDLNLTDLLFNYGVRINYNITKDIYSSSIRLASGNIGNQTQYEDFLWHYYPIIISDNNHPISTNLDPVLLKFPSSIDTLQNDIFKTILLQSSPFTKLMGTPVNISLNEISNKPTEQDYNNGHQIFGVLLEGEFKSAYSNRVKPFETNFYKEKGIKNKMVIISDGDIIANEIYKGDPLPLDIDKWTNQPYGNSSLLLNTIHYLLNDSGILKLRSKNLQIQFLDKEKAYQEKNYWQIFNLILPLIILGSFGLIFNYYRKRKYSS
ncbi:MAG: gliding motility-associated ABC transporter substrate-binding protein GldG [Flavobacteriaceae bacterium]|nr:gliding motility-associated ABC transporter substrate-binding protein GldG [Flavobacteriaceae bacterium]